MHILPVIGFLSLLSACGVLLFAFLRSQRIARDLAVQLTHAREQQHQDKIQLTERSQLYTLKDEFISTVSHELRTPLTSIRGALGLLSSGVIGDVDAKALNLLRIAAPDVGFVLDALPAPQPLFALLAEMGGIGPAEMYQTFNMGVGFCIVVAEADAPRAIALLRALEPAAAVIGRAVHDPDKKMVLPGAGLVGAGKTFRAGR